MLVAAEKGVRLTMAPSIDFGGADFVSSLEMSPGSLWLLRCTTGCTADQLL